MDLSIIIVNWNSKEYLRKCLSSILSSTHGLEYEIIVIDSASFDGCDKMLKQHYPHVRFIQSDLNLGFARSNNLAFEVSSGQAILFLNPDTEVENNAIPELLCQLESLPQAGAVGGMILNSDRTPQTTCIRAFPTILSELLDAEILQKQFPSSRLWGMTPLQKKSMQPVEVDAISGACLMIKRSIFEDIGLFSNDYFMYSEDIDLCFKVQQCGWKNYFVPASVIVHHGGGSSTRSKVSAFSSVMMLESRWRFFRNNRTIWYSWLYRTAMFSASAVRIGLLFSALLIFGVLGKTSSIEVSLKNWIARLRWTIGLENWAKNY